jgi:FlaA1/EpsC-like NDP-sugar epimerase
MPILRLPRTLKRVTVLLVDVSLCILSVYLAFYLRLGEWVPVFSVSSWKPISVVAAAIILGIPIFSAFGLYREIFRYSGWFALTTLAKAMFLYGFIFFSIFTLIGVPDIPRTIGIIQPLILFMLVGCTRAFASYWLGNSYRKQLRLASIPKVLIYGAGEAGRQLAAALFQSFEMQVVGFLDDDYRLHGNRLVGNRIYNPDDLSDIVSKLGVSGILLAIPSTSRFRRNQIIQLAAKAKISIQTLPSMSDLASGKVGILDLRSLDIDDLLGREPVIPSTDLMSKNSHQKTVMITGAGGSIGSELCLQIIKQQPNTLILLDWSEFALYKIHQDLIGRLEKFESSCQIKIIPLLGSVTDANRINLIIKKYKPHTIYHAAAYKHVPLVESNLIEGVKNNILGTLVVARIASELGVSNFILISTDKAVRPTNVMGASKRIAEMVIQALAQITSSTNFAIVRFGNVLDSSGSVIPKFRQQIRDGGPVTVTDFRVTRYFMTIPEAAQLVIQAGALANGGEVFLLDMGESIKIVDLAKRMIELSGLDVRDEKTPDGDIEIVEIGLRPGEKLYEELLLSGDPKVTSHSRIYKAHEEFLEWAVIDKKLAAIQQMIHANDQDALIDMLQEMVPNFSHNELGKISS